MSRPARGRGCKGLAFVKRLLAASVLAAGLTTWGHVASAAPGASGGAQLQWRSMATATLALATQYNAAFAQGNAAPTLLPSAVGVCAPGASEANYTLTFGALTPSKAVPAACLYKNALAIAVTSNGASGFSVTEYLDSTPTTGIGICAFPNGGASFPLVPAVAPVATSGRSGNPAAGTYAGMNLTSCAAGGAIVPPGTGGASSGGTVPGNPGTPSLEFYSPSGSGLSVMTSGTTTVSGGAIVAMYGAQDVQVNLAPNALSTTGGYTGLYMTVQLIVN